ncbi:MAG: hypothetical protein OK452_04320 [Thaumarchaeota archaeon]|nr:hypothetical protein [Nitrososphaerota archaeon]
MEFLLLAEGLLGIVIAANPSILDIPTASLSPAQLFSIMVLTLIMVSVLLYGRILTGKSLPTAGVSGFAFYFSFTIGLATGAAFTKLLMLPSSFETGAFVIIGISLTFFIVYAMLPALSQLATRQGDS